VILKLFAKTKEIYTLKKVKQKTSSHNLIQDVYCRIKNCWAEEGLKTKQNKTKQNKTKQWCIDMYFRGMSKYKQTIRWPLVEKKKKNSQNFKAATIKMCEK
jgi:hypothetical protein